MQLRGLLMQIFIILSIFNFICAMSYLKNKLFYRNPKNGDENHLKEIFKRSQKIRLNDTEMKQFYDSFNIVLRQSKHLILYIRKCQRLINEENSITELSSEITSYIDIFRQLRKKSRNHYSCEYEFYKFCEFLYQAIDYILGLNDEIPKNAFFEFLSNEIMDILLDIDFDLFISMNEICRTIENEKLKNVKNQVSEKMRHSSIRNFCIKYLIEEGMTLLDHFKEGFSNDDSLLLYSKIFIKLLLTRNQKVNFKNSIAFIPSEYSFSCKLKNFLIINANLTDNVVLMRILLNKFLVENHVDIETQLVEQEIIPPVFDVINDITNIMGSDEI